MMLVSSCVPASNMEGLLLYLPNVLPSCQYDDTETKAVTTAQQKPQYRRDTAASLKVSNTVQMSLEFTTVRYELSHLRFAALVHI